MFNMIKMEYYNDNIQIDKNVITDVFKNIQTNTRMLVFGLGYDSKMWYEGTNKNTFFVEDKDEYIELNKDDIPLPNIIRYDYKNITCESSANKTAEDLESYKMPEKLLLYAPYDIILIDGPEGWTPLKPGRLIPCFWSRSLSKPGTLIYVDDSKRTVENYAINRFFPHEHKDVFPERGCCTKIYL